ncbi:MAG: sensor histidine kinase [Pseudomonadota bacterium]
MLNRNYHLDFERGRFPFRLIFISFALLFMALGFSNGTYWDSAVTPFQLVIFGGVLLVWILVSLIMLRILYGLISSRKIAGGIFVCWLTMTGVALVIYLFLLIYSDFDPERLRQLTRGVLTPTTGRTLVIMVAVFSPFLLWVESVIFANKAALAAMETKTFSNLDFRIRPHFLFNTLNSVAGLISIHPKRAETALYYLADVFRVVMADKRQLVPLKAELDLAEKYLFLEKTRLGERLKISSKIDPKSVGIRVPVLLLQPLLENAVYHGIETRFKGGTITMNIRVIDNELIIKITNPLPEGNIKRESGNKVAQDNLRDRMTKSFGRKSSLDAYQAESSYNVIVRIPL